MDDTEGKISTDHTEGSISANGTGNCVNFKLDKGTYLTTALVVADGGVSRVIAEWEGSWDS